MDQEEIKKSIVERFNNLQPEVQAAIMSSDYEKNLYEISQKHKLSLDQMTELEFNTTLVMLGQTHPDQYEQELIEDLKLPKEKVDEIISDINEKILKNIREILKGNFEREDKEERDWENVPTPPYASNALAPTVPKLEMSPKPIAPVSVPVNLPEAENVSSSVEGIEFIKDKEAISEKVGVKPIVEPNIKTETKILQNSGIDVMPERVPEEFKRTAVVEAETLAGINNPTKGVSSMLGNKLTNTTVAPMQTSDHTISKDNVSSNKKMDPYRENIG